ncbi:MAG: sigma-70 family RNA polymerase sigma factor [Bacteroidota bacterium]
MSKELFLAKHILSGSRIEKREALRFLYRKCFPSLRKLIGPEWSDEAVEDIYHEGLARMYDSLQDGRFRGEAKLSTYLITICKNLWLMEIRSNKVTYNSDLIAEQTEVANKRLDAQYLSEVMDEMNKECRSVLSSFYYENKSMQEIQQDFGLGSVQAAKNKKSRCLKKLISLFQQKGITYDSFIE